MGVKSVGGNGGSINSPWRSTAEIAEYLRVCERTLKKWRSDGTGPPYRHHGGKVQYHIDEVVTWAMTNRAKVTAAAEDNGQLAFDFMTKPPRGPHVPHA